MAVPGSQRDGCEFVDQALAAGASLVLAHTKEGGVSLDGEILYLPHLSMRLGELGRTDR